MTEFRSAGAPKYLYKYRSLQKENQKFTREIIEMSKLWCGSALALNDPFDCSPIPLIPDDLNGRRSLLEKALGLSDVPVDEKQKTIENVLSGSDELLGELAAGAVDHLRKDIGVLSLSASGKIDRMWQDYSDRYTGVCLQFCDHPEDPPMFSLARRVLYVAERPTIEFYPYDKDEFIQKYLLTKTCKWSVEEEWRLVDPKYTGSVQFPPRALRAVILGSSISEGDRETVSDWMNSAQSDAQILDLEEIL